ncbi:MAG: hypothetical protein LBT14_13345 [Treponema sp.]|jgi:hypothetical protein|nr:hypothetical protein [Treponema sp.]
MKYLWGTALITFFLIQSYAAPAPAWYPDPERVYPRAQYISGMGRGITAGEAQAEALSVIALYFKSSVKTENELLLQYNQIVSGNRVQEIRNIQERNLTKIASLAEFRGVRLTAPWYDEESREWVMLGYIDKQEAPQRWQNRINTNLMFMESLIEMGNRQPELLFKFSYLKAAVAIAQVIEADIRASGEVLDSTSQFRETLETARMVMAGYQLLRSELTFEVHNIQGDRQGRIQYKLSELLEKNHYTVVPQDALYSIEGAISTNEKIFPAAGFYVYAGGNLRLINRERKVLRSFTIPEERRGTMTDLDLAYRRAFLYLEDYLEHTIILEITACIDG